MYYAPRKGIESRLYDFHAPVIYHAAAQAASYVTSALDSFTESPRFYTLNLDHRVEMVDKKAYKQQEYQQEKHVRDEFIPDMFLKPSKTWVRFVGSAEDVRTFVEDAFFATIGKPLPQDIILHVLSLNEFKAAHAQFDTIWDEAIQGFSINRMSLGLPGLVFSRRDRLDKVLLTLGHEIGHVLAPTLKDKHNEEAKAFAFSIAWMRAIKEQDIASVGQNIELNPPAPNGLHNVACDFVLKHMKEGEDPLALFSALVKGHITCNKDVLPCNS